MRNLMLCAISILLAACAQVPKQSVELSNTVGRDIAEIQRSHAAFVNLYYDQMEASANRFVDDVYVPYLVGETLKDPEVGGELAKAIAEAGAAGADEKTKKDTLEALGYYFLSTSENIEQFRKKTLQPLKAQRKTILDGLEASYQRVIEGNAAVTGYLASVVKVTDEQNRLLAKAGVPDLQTQIAEKADRFNREIEKLNREAQKVTNKLSDTRELEDVVKKGEKLIDAITN